MTDYFATWQYPEQNIARCNIVIYQMSLNVSIFPPVSFCWRLVFLFLPPLTLLSKRQGQTHLENLRLRNANAFKNKNYGLYLFVKKSNLFPTCVFHFKPVETYLNTSLLNLTNWKYWTSEHIR